MRICVHSRTSTIAGDLEVALLELGHNVSISVSDPAIAQQVQNFINDGMYSLVIRHDDESRMSAKSAQ